MKVPTRIYPSFPGLTVSCVPLQGDRGEVGPPGPAGFAGPPVSKVTTIVVVYSLNKEYSHQFIDILSSPLLCLVGPGCRWSAWC